MDPASSIIDQSRCPEQERARWFANEVRPHEGQLRSYLHGRFPAVRDVDDVVQESYLRIWRARAAQPIASAKAFLFAIARHLAVDDAHRSRRRQEIALGDSACPDVIDEKPNAAETLSYNEKVCLLADVLARLPTRCREVVVLRKLNGLSQKEVAAQLGLSERTVENQLARGMKRCEAMVLRQGHRTLFSR